jgi:hypothetical protein
MGCSHEKRKGRVERKRMGVSKRNGSVGRECMGCSHEKGKGV